MKKRCKKILALLTATAMTMSLTALAEDEESEYIPQDYVSEEAAGEDSAAEPDDFDYPGAEEDYEESFETEDSSETEGETEGETEVSSETESEADEGYSGDEEGSVADDTGTGSAESSENDENDGNQCGENVYWSFDSSTGVLTISGTGDMYNYGEVSSPWATLPVTTVVVEEGVTSIGNAAFWYLSELKSVDLPSSLTSIGANAFTSCSSLESIDIPDSVTVIWSGAFLDCTSLTTVHLGNSVTTIFRSAFANCAFSEIIFPASLTFIYGDALEGTPCSTVVFLGDAIEPYVYNNLAGITATVYYPADNATWTTDEMKELMDSNDALTWVPYTIDAESGGTASSGDEGSTSSDDAECVHNYEIFEVVEPTCTEDGYTVYKCTICGDTYQSDFAEAFGHQYFMTEEGVLVCAVCGDILQTTGSSASSEDDLTSSSSEAGSDDSEAGSKENNKNDDKSQSTGSGKNAKAGEIDEAVATGDYTPITMYIVLLGAALCVMIAAVRRKVNG